jgi:GTPase
MLIDDVKINATAGNGGTGAQTYIGMRKGKKIGPTGGDGGRGGDIYFIASHNINDLSEFQYKKEIKAGHGENGQIKNHNGRDAADVTIKVPVGTILKVEKYDRTFEITDSESPVLVLKGGEGQLGSFRLNKVGVQRENRIGESSTIHLSLTLIADIGLIGLPNAGKSSLLKSLTNANPKIGNYQFTTLEPNLGVLDNLILADIPGLIEGASEGKGLGIKFLKHIEKTKAILHCIAFDDPDPIKTYETVRKEFEKYNKELLNKKEIIILTKKDLATEEEIEDKQKLFKGKEVLAVSIYDEKSLEELKNKLITL